MNEQEQDEDDRLSLDVTIQENGREEDVQAFQQYITDMFHHVYDEVDVSVTEANDDG